VVNALRKTYGRFSVDIDFKINDGETLVLAGPSGCGKTTALRMIAGLVIPDSGTILLDGVDVRDIPAWKRNIGVVFQDLALFPHLSVGGNVAYGPFVHGVGKQERERIVETCLAQARLEGYAKRRVDTLSGGERQRAAIARALAASPSALLMDEPFSSLDAPLRRELRLEFRELRERVEYPCLFVTHDREEAATVGDRVAIMNAGRIIEIGKPRELFLSPRTAFAARFLDAGAVLEAEVMGKEDGKERVRSVVGTTTIKTEGKESGKKRTMMLPRDALRLVSADAANAVCRAIVRSSVFSGERETLSVELANGATLKVETPGRMGPFLPGTNVGLEVDESLLYFLAD
jgi:ABC-type Fe3+/spermidine/putrescine transport system ATPase subunit